LKPVVCRRVVGRPPSPPLETTGWPPLAASLRKELPRMVYLVRSLGFSPESFHLTTGTFNLVVKDRIAFRLSGAPSVQSKPAVTRARRSRPHKSACPRNPIKLLSALYHCQPAVPTGFPPVLHTASRTAHAGTVALDCPVERSSTVADTCAQQNSSSAWLKRTIQCLFRHEPTRKILE